MLRIKNIIFVAPVYKITALHMFFARKLFLLSSWSFTENLEISIFQNKSIRKHAKRFASLAVNSSLPLFTVPRTVKQS